MPQIVECPSGHRLKVPRKFAGHRIACPVCNASLAVPLQTLPPRRKTSTPHQPTELDATDKSQVTDTSTTNDTSGQKEIASANSTLAAKSREASDSPTTAETAPATFECKPHLEKTSAQPPAERNTPESSITSKPPQSLEDGPVVDADVISHAPQRLAQSSEIEFPSIDPSQFEQDQLQQDQLQQDHLELLPFHQMEQTSVYEEFIVVDQHDLSNSPRNWESASDFVRGQQYGAMLLGLFAMLVAAVCTAPAVVEHWNARQGGNPPDLWTFPVLLAALIQTGIAIFATRVADWSTSWTATMVTTFIAATYALGLALTIFANDEHAVVQQLGLLDEAYQRTAQPWCFFATCITLILAYAYGRFSIRWYRLERQFASSR